VALPADVQAVAVTVDDAEAGRIEKEVSPYAEAMHRTMLSAAVQ
jgi:hypothetical protein